MINLMIVDDEKLTREGLLRILPWNDLGIGIVEVAGDGSEALAVASRIQPDIILCDIRLPDINGIELAGKLKNMLPECKIVFLSAYTDKEYLKSAIQLKAFSYLEKPISREDLKNAVMDVVSTIIDERNKLLENYSIFKEKLVTDMIDKHMVSEEFQRRVITLRLDIPTEGDFVTAIIKLDMQADILANMLQSQKLQILKSVELVNIHPQVRQLAGFKDSNHILVHFYGKEIRDTFFSNEWLKTLKNSIEIILGINLGVFIGIGRHVNAVSVINESYQTAVIALQKQFFEGYDKIAIYREENGGWYKPDETIIKQFRAYLIEYEKEKAVGLIRSFTAELEKNTHILISDIKNIFYNMLLNLSEFAEGLNIQLIKKNEGEFIWEIISEISTLGKIEEYMVDRVEFVFEKLSTMNNVGQNVYNIMQYIRDHFQETELTINDIARHMYLTTTHICMVFKNKTGKTINQYITEVRIEKAKELLKEGNMKLLEISNRVGYLSPNHFAKIFRKNTGLNPSDFRERHYL